MARVRNFVYCGINTVQIVYKKNIFLIVTQCELSLSKPFKKISLLHLLVTSYLPALCI